MGTRRPRTVRSHGGAVSDIVWKWLDALSELHEASGERSWAQEGGTFGAMASFTSDQTRTTVGAREEIRSLRIATHVDPWNVTWKDYPLVGTCTRAVEADRAARTEDACIDERVRGAIISHGGDSLRRAHVEEEAEGFQLYLTRRYGTPGVVDGLPEVMAALRILVAVEDGEDEPRGAADRGDRHGSGSRASRPLAGGISDQLRTLDGPHAARWPREHGGGRPATRPLHARSLRRRGDGGEAADDVHVGASPADQGHCGDDDLRGIGGGRVRGRVSGGTDSSLAGGDRLASGDKGSTV